MENDTIAYRVNYERWPEMNPDLDRPIPKDRRLYVLKRDKYLCVYCGTTAKDMDHVLPITRGGMHDVLNMVTCCRPCNSSKGNRTPDEWQPSRWIRSDSRCQEGDRPVSFLDD